MRYSDILAKFLELFPTYVDQVTQWAPSGRRGIVMTLKNGVGLSFIYRDDVTWTLEASDGFPTRRV